MFSKKEYPSVDTASFQLDGGFHFIKIRHIQWEFFTGDEIEDFVDFRPQVNSTLSEINNKVFIRLYQTHYSTLDPLD